jgi:hypothetical protein
LGIPLELEDDGIDSLKMEHLTWSCLLALAWWRQLQILPHTPLWEIPAPSFCWLELLFLKLQEAGSTAAPSSSTGHVFIFSRRGGQRYDRPTAGSLPLNETCISASDSH